MKSNFKIFKIDKLKKKTTTRHLIKRSLDKLRQALFLTDGVSNDDLNREKLSFRIINVKIIYFFFFILIFFNLIFFFI